MWYFSYSCLSQMVSVPNCWAWKKTCPENVLFGNNTKKKKKYIFEQRRNTNQNYDTDRNYDIIYFHCINWQKKYMMVTNLESRKDLQKKCVVEQCFYWTISTYQNFLILIKCWCLQHQQDISTSLYIHFEVSLSKVYLYQVSWI